jgi:thymidylate synthase (FAD)
MTVKLMWATPDGDGLVGYMARVSNPNAQPDDDASRLISYLLRHRHHSPFEMVNACVEIHTTRDISRQILRHRSFSFQEFSGRYAEYVGMGSDLREARLQDYANRQNSYPTSDPELAAQWKAIQETCAAQAEVLYHEALDLGIAKEQARAVLPEGLTPTKMYMNGTLRSWIHYWEVRTGPETQKEHRLIAEETRNVILCKFPHLNGALVNQ